MATTTSALSIKTGVILNKLAYSSDDETKNGCAQKSPNGHNHAAKTTKAYEQNKTNGCVNGYTNGENKEEIHENKEGQELSERVQVTVLKEEHEKAETAFEKFDNHLQRFLSEREKTHHETPPGKLGKIKKELRENYKYFSEGDRKELDEKYLKNKAVTESSDIEVQKTSQIIESYVAPKKSFVKRLGRELVEATFQSYDMKKMTSATAITLTTSSLGYLNQVSGKSQGLVSEVLEGALIGFAIVTVINLIHILRELWKENSDQGFITQKKMP